MRSFLLAVVAWLAPLMVLLAVVPVFKARYAAWGLRLPPVTEAAIAASDWLIAYPLVPATIVVTGLFLLWRARDRWRPILFLPLVVAALLLAAMVVPEVRLHLALRR